jgi:hypothetical protein
LFYFIAKTAQQKEFIEKQYEERRDKINREAGEKLKRQKKAEVYISLASEIAAIALQASQNPANAITFGAAGITQFAILSAIAGAKSAIQIATINKQQFEHGGQVPTSTGGPIYGPSHSSGGVPFNYEAEGGELAIINKRSASAKGNYTVSGNLQQIASAINTIGGGTSFSNGAKVSKFEYGGYLGSVLQAPVYTPSNTLVNNSTNIDMTEFINAIDRRFDRMQVHQVTNSVTKAQGKEVKQIQLSTIF